MQCIVEWFYFAAVIVQFTSNSSRVNEGSGNATLELSAIGQTAISIAVRYALNN